MTRKNEQNDGEMKLPEGSKAAKISRGALQVVGGAVPFAGGLLSAIAGAWSEDEQEKVNRFFEYWVRMLQDELKEKEDTIIQYNRKFLFVGQVANMSPAVFTENRRTFVNIVKIKESTNLHKFSRIKTKKLVKINVMLELC